VAVRAKSDSFQKDLDDSTAAPLSKFEKDAGESGTLAGANLSKGVKTGTKDLEQDMGNLGTRSGTALASGTESHMGGIKSALSSLGVPTSLLGGWGALGVAVLGVGLGALKLGTEMQSADRAIAVASGTSVAAATAIGDAFLGEAGHVEFSGQQMATAFAAVAGQLATTEGHALTTGQAVTVMAAATDLATAKQIDLGDATGVLSGIMQAFQIPVKGAAAAANVLFNASNATGQSVDAIGASLEKLRSKLGDASPPLSALTALMVDMTKQGITGRTSLTAVQAAMTSLIGAATGATKAGVASAAALKSFGLTAVNAKGQLTPMSDIIAGLGPKYAKMTQAQQLATSTTIFGTSSAKAMTSVIDAGSKAYGAATAAVTKHNAVEHAAAMQSATLSGEFRIVKAAVIDWTTELGAKLIPMLGQVASVLIGAVQDGFHAVKQAVEAVTVGVKAAWGFLDAHQDTLHVLEAALGLVAAAFVAEGIAAAAAWAATLSPITLIVAAFVAVAVAAGELEKHWSLIWGTIERDAEEAINKVIGFLNNLIRGYDDVVGVIPFFGSHMQVAQIALLNVANAANTATAAVLTLQQALATPETSVPGGIGPKTAGELGTTKAAILASLNGSGGGGISGGGISGGGGGGGGGSSPGVKAANTAADIAKKAAAAAAKITKASAEDEAKISTKAAEALTKADAKEADAFNKQAAEWTAATKKASEEAAAISKAAAEAWKKTVDAADAGYTKANKDAADQWKNSAAGTSKANDSSARATAAYLAANAKTSAAITAKTFVDAAAITKAAGIAWTKTLDTADAGYKKANDNAAAQQKNSADYTTAQAKKTADYLAANAKESAALTAKAQKDAAAAAAKITTDAATKAANVIAAVLTKSQNNLSNAQAQGGIIGDQQTIANDIANMAGLTGDALAVAQDQLAIDQQKLAWDKQDLVLQQAVASAQGQVAQAAAQAALNNYDALQTIQQATLAAALSNAQNQTSIDAANAPSSSGSAPSSGSGYVEDPTLATNAAAFNAANNVVLPPDWAANGIVPTMAAGTGSTGASDAFALGVGGALSSSAPNAAPTVGTAVGTGVAAAAASAANIQSVTDSATDTLLSSIGLGASANALATIKLLTSISTTAGTNPLATDKTLTAVKTSANTDALATDKLLTTIGTSTSASAVSAATHTTLLTHVAGSLDTHTTLLGQMKTLLASLASMSNSLSTITTELRSGQAPLRTA
jgi:hypothetical protein